MADENLDAQEAAQRAELVFSTNTYLNLVRESLTQMAQTTTNGGTRTELQNALGFLQLKGEVTPENTQILPRQSRDTTAQGLDLGFNLRISLPKENKHIHIGVQGGLRMADSSATTARSVAHEQRGTSVYDTIARASSERTVMDVVVSQNSESSRVQFVGAYPARYVTLRFSLSQDANKTLQLLTLNFNEDGPGKTDPRAIVAQLPPMERPGTPPVRPPSPPVSPRDTLAEQATPLPPAAQKALEQRATADRVVTSFRDTVKTLVGIRDNLTTIWNRRRKK